MCCQTCNYEVSKEAKACPNRGAPIKKKEGILKKIVWGFLGLCVLSAIVRAGGSNESNLTCENTSEVSSSSNITLKILIPEKQNALISISEQFASRYAVASNELQKSALRSKRKDALCNVFGEGLEFTDWIGSIKTMSTTGDGNAHIAISLKGAKATRIVICNNNNEMSDALGNSTLIPKGTELYESVSSLNEGQQVRVSGFFQKADQDFIMEQSLTERGSMTEPEYNVKFLKIGPL